MHLSELDRSWFPLSSHDGGDNFSFLIRDGYRGLLRRRSVVRMLANPGWGDANQDNSEESIEIQERRVALR